MKKLTFAVLVFSLIMQRAFGQVQVIGGFPAQQSPEQVLSSGMQPIQNAMNTYVQRQFEINRMLEQQAFAAQQQARRLEAEKQIAKIHADTVAQAKANIAMNARLDDDANKSRITNAVVSIENLK